MLTLIKLFEARSFFLLVNCMEEQIAAKEAAEGALDARSKNQVRELRWSTRVIKVLCAILVLCLLYACAKVAGIFICRDMLFNLTGCVEMPNSLTVLYHSS